MSGEDVVVLAGTGSGKTEAGARPTVSRHLDALIFAETPVVLYIATDPRSGERHLPPHSAGS